MKAATLSTASTTEMVRLSNRCASISACVTKPNRSPIRRARGPKKYSGTMPTTPYAMM